MSQEDKSFWSGVDTARWMKAMLSGAIFGWGVVYLSGDVKTGFAVAAIVYTLWRCTFRLLKKMEGR